MSVRTYRLRTLHNPGGPGFTLIELLVSVIIIAVISSVALLSLGILGDDRDLQREARRLASLIELANDEAAIQGRDFGLEITRTGYRFVEYDPLSNRWHEVVGDDYLRTRRLQEGMELDLFLEDRRVTLKFDPADIENDDDKMKRVNDYAPHILIMSSGDVSPFELRLFRSSDRASLLLSMSVAGELEVESDDQQMY